MAEWRIIVPAFVVITAVLCSAGGLRSLCLMIYRFYANELPLSKCIIWSLVTRATVQMFCSGHKAQGENRQQWTSLLCVQLRVMQAKVECCLMLIIRSRDSQMVTRLCFVFRLKFKHLTFSLSVRDLKTKCNFTLQLCGTVSWRLFGWVWPLHLQEYGDLYVYWLYISYFIYTREKGTINN